MIVLLISCKSELDSLQSQIDDIKNRVESLETVCSKMNSDITALQTITAALQNNNYITHVTSIIENEKEIGYSITFTNGDVINIYHGRNGQDGYTPVIGVAQDINGEWYWTLDGEWYTDLDGNKIPTTGEDGKDGKDGMDGEDGITPTLKIEDANWYVSFDNGLTWDLLGEAKGKDGDSFFSSVKTDDENAYFYFIDGSSIAIPLVKDNYVSKIQSITFVPRFSDNKGAVISTTREYSFVELDFSVSPPNIAASIVANYSTDADLQAVGTFTKSFDFHSLPITEMTADAENGIITVKALCKGLSDDFFNGAEGTSVVLQISDGDYNASSSYVQIEPAKRLIHNSDKSAKVVAHRGYWDISGSAQNSITALRKANEINAWGCELDLWMTSDGVLVLNHDGVIDGITIQTSPYSAIKNCKLSNGETIPTFEEYLTVFKNECTNLILIVELKPHYSTQATTNAIKNIIKTVNRYKIEHLVEYISFSPVACDAIVRYAPTARVAYLESDLTPQQCAERGYTGVDYHYSTYQNNPTLVTEAHNLGLEVNTWTLNWFTIVKEMYLTGIDILTTDQPENVEAWLNTL